MDSFAMKKKWLNQLVLKVVPTLASIFSNIVGHTTKLQIIAPEDLSHKKALLDWPQGVIYAMWHSRFFYFSYYAKGKKVVTMISSSKDGEFITKTIQKMRLYAIRGSSSKAGKQAMYQMVEVLKENAKVLMLPDGPRGPRHEMKNGVIRLAQLTGRPILPASFSTTSGIFLPSWDRFLLPLPWGKAALVVDKPIFVPPVLTEEEFEQIRLSLQEKLTSLTEEADRICKRNPEKEALFFLRKKR